MGLMEGLARGVPTLTTWGAIEDKENEAFKNGKELGFELAIEEAFKKKCKVTEGITEEEQHELWDFLVEKNLSICYDVMNGGLLIRKLMTDENHAKEMVARMTKKEFNN